MTRTVQKVDSSSLFILNRFCHRETVTKQRCSISLSVAPIAKTEKLDSRDSFFLIFIGLHCTLMKVNIEFVVVRLALWMGEVRLNIPHQLALDKQWNRINQSGRPSHFVMEASAA